MNFMVGYADIYVAGLLGPAVQAAVGFASQQYLMLLILANSLGVGVVALVSHASGQQNQDRVINLTRQALLLALVLSFSISIVTFFGSDLVTSLFKLPVEVAPLARAYIRIYGFALVPGYIVLIASSVLRAVGRPVIAFRVISFAALLSVAGDFVLVFGVGPFQGQGYTGVALATAAGNLLGFALVLLVLSGREWKQLWRRQRHSSPGTLVELARISWPAFLLQVAWNAGNLAIYQILGYLGVESVHGMAAYANGLRLESITFLPAFAINMAVAVLVGQSLGSGDPERAKTIGWRTAWIGTLSLGLFAGMLFIAAPAVAGFLTKDPGVWAETVRYLRVNLAVAPLMTFSVVLGGAMQGAGDTRGVMAVILFSIWAIRIPLAVVLCFVFGLGALGVWLAMDVSMAVQTFLMTRRFLKGGWLRVASSTQGA